MNYFIVHKASNTIVEVVASSFDPAPSLKFKAFKVTDGYLNLYYARLKQANGQPVDLYSVLPAPKIPEIIPLSKKDKADLTEFVRANHSRQTVDAMAHNWRVSPRTIRRIINSL